MAHIDIFNTFTPTAQSMLSSGANLSTDWIDLQQSSQVRDIGSGADLYLQTTITTAFTATSNANPVRFELHAYPQTTLTSTTTTPVDVASNTITLAGHNLVRGQPLFFTALGTVATWATSVVYFAIPLTADTFRIASSLANALAGTPLVPTGSNSNVTIQWVPTVLASTGDVHRGLLLPGVRLYALTNPIVGSTLLSGGSYARPIPRYLFGVGVHAAAAAGGAVLMHLVSAAQDGQRFMRSGFLASN